MTEADCDVLEVRSKLGESIRKTRIELGLTQRELAGRAGINRTYLIDVEEGRRNIAVDNFLEIALALDTTISSLFEKASL